MTEARGAGAVHVEEAVCRFGETVAVAGVTLQVTDGEFVSLLGPSGCGKTTLLRSIAGLQPLESGRVRVGGRDITRAPPHRRPVNMVFQRYALFPHMTVADNVGFGLELQKVERAERHARVERILELVRLPGYGGRRVDQLSGGQAQRVALARALVTDPPVLLLDEPLAALDRKLRQAMQLELREIQRRIGTTFIYVTHDQEEAMAMSDRIVLMEEGRIVQEGTPEELYKRPATLFASRFVGETNLFEGVVERNGTGNVLAAGPVRLSMPRGPGAGADAWASVRPEQITLGPVGDCTRIDAAEGVIGRVVFLGPIVRYLVEVGEREVIVDRPAGEDERRFVTGDRVCLRWASADVVPVST
jgi:spermidine/putrescine transport system ATP-binding protein